MITRQRQWVAALLALVCLLLPAVAHAANGDVIDISSQRADFKATWALLDGVTAAPDSGAWIDYRGYTNGNLEVSGIAAATVQFFCSNATTKPANGTDGTQWGANITSNGLTPISGPCRFVKAKLSANGGGTAITARLTATTQGGGGSAAVGSVTASGDTTKLGGNAIDLNNGAAGAGTQRVTIASDSTGTVASTQSGAWSVGQTGTWSSRIQDGAGTGYSSVATGAIKSFPVAIVDAAGAQITSFGGTNSNFGAAFPAPGTAAGFSDGTNMQGARAFDYDTGVGAQYVLGVGLRAPGNGGSTSLLDTAATRGYFQLTDGTNSPSILNAAPSGASVYGVVVRPYTSTDGTNVTPTMDAAARRGYVNLTDGTTNVGVDAGTGGLKSYIVNGSTTAAENDSLSAGATGVAQTIATSYIWDGLKFVRARVSMTTLVSGASNNATSVKAAAGCLYGYYITNTNAAIRYVKFYNKASAPAPASDTPVLALGIPAGGAANLVGTNCVEFTTGLAYATVTGSATNDNTSVGSGDLIVNLLYK